jgi:hypothetical protein
MSEIISREPLEEQMAAVKNNQIMARLTLRELCLKAVVNNVEYFNKVRPDSPAHRVESLRKELLLLII